MKTSAQLQLLALTLLISVAAAMLLAPPAATVLADNDNDNGKSRFTLGGTAEGAVDPVDSGNKVVRMEVSATLFGFVRRKLDRRTQVEDLTNQLSFHFRFATGGSCGGGSPRYQLAIDTDGDGVSNGNAFGYAGPPPSFTGCPANAWLFQDLTGDGLTRWDLSQFNAELAAVGQPSVPFVITWQQVLTVFGNFPNHRVMTGALVDDTFTGSGRGIGFAFYDNIEIGDKKLRKVSFDD